MMLRRSTSPAMFLALPTILAMAGGLVIMAPAPLSGQGSEHLSGPVVAQTAPEVPPSAYAEGAIDAGDPRVETRLLVDRVRVSPGQTLRVGVRFDIDPHWHIYWRNAGEAGLSTRVTWGSASELGFGPLQWPAPHAFADRSGKVVTFGYADNTLLYADLSVPSDARGEVEIEATADYLACRVKCIPGRATMRRTISVGAADPKQHATEQDSAAAALFDRAAAARPLSAREAGVSVEVRLPDGLVVAGAEAQAELLLSA